MARGYAEASATVFHPSDPPPVPQGRPSSASASYHVGLDTMMGRRSRHRPEEVAIDGFLLLDTGEYELVTAHHPARRLLEDEGPRHPRPGPHREPGSRCTTLRLSRRRQRLAGRWRPRAAHDRRRPTAKQHTPEPRADGGAELLPTRGRGPCARAGGVEDQARTMRASESSGCGFARSIRSIGWPSNRKVPGSSRPCTCGTCFRSSRRIEPRRGATKSPARRRASLVRSESGQSVPAQSSTSRCASSRVLPYFF